MKSGSSIGNFYPDGQVPDLEFLCPIHKYIGVLTKCACRSIRLPNFTSDYQPFGSSGSSSGNILDAVASVPWFHPGPSGIAYVFSTIDNLVGAFRSRRGSVNEDLRFEDGGVMLVGTVLIYLRSS
ncbi:hypothetical protein EDC04DRAFT_1136583 [Pisolithus marmoratus]|nr:hypothetical protein EDC04DRAFT_1136583 [Pisolithus marmoratus]